MWGKALISILCGVTNWVMNLILKDRIVLGLGSTFAPSVLARATPICIKMKYAYNSWNINILFRYELYVFKFTIRMLNLNASISATHAHK